MCLGRYDWSLKVQEHKNSADKCNWTTGHIFALFLLNSIFLLLLFPSSAHETGQTWSLDAIVLLWFIHITLCHTAGFFFRKKEFTNSKSPSEGTKRSMLRKRRPLHKQPMLGSSSCLVLICAVHPRAPGYKEPAFNSGKWVEKRTNFPLWGSI